MGAEDRLPLIYKDVGYNAGTFVPVARIGDTMEMLAVHPAVPARSVAELVSLAKSRPGVLNFGSAGVGTLPHLEGELLKARAQIDISHIPYRGGNQALTGLLGGEIQILFSTLTQVLPHVRDGRLRALAVAGEARSPLAPELPTMVESGFDQFVMTSITGHLEGELLKARAQIDISHIPYRGGNQALTGLLGGEIQILFSTLTQVLPHVRDGRLRALAVAGEARSPLAPELPTMVESGFDQFVMTSITGIVAPPGTPPVTGCHVQQSEGETELSH